MSERGYLGSYNKSRSGPHEQAHRRQGLTLLYPNEIAVLNRRCRGFVFPRDRHGEAGHGPARAKVERPRQPRTGGGRGGCLTRDILPLRGYGLDIRNECQARQTTRARQRLIHRTDRRDRTRPAVTHRRGRHGTRDGRGPRIERLAQADQHIQYGADEQRHEIGPRNLRPVRRTDLVRAGGEPCGEGAKDGVVSMTSRS